MIPLGIDLVGTPFSRRGSYFAVSRIRGAQGGGIFLRTVHGDARQRELLRLIVGGDAAPRAAVTAGRLRLSSDGSAAELTLTGAGRSILRVLSGTLTLDLQVLSQYDVVLQERPDVWRFIASGANRNYRIAFAGGLARFDGAWDGVKDTAARLTVDAASGPVTVTIDEFGSTAPAFVADDFETVADEAERDFASWLALHGATEHATEHATAIRLAAFVTWAALVPPGGALRRESMLMSKNWMANVWAWDHCFNAIALWRDPEAAADQLFTLFDHQDEYGALPDYVNDAGVEPNFVKPPIHGWAIGRLLDLGGLTVSAVEALYEPLARWTDWWFTQRDYGADGVPSYNHGNDSGWDNSTVFSGGVPVQSPDLLAFLALQMTTLARMARRLDDPGAASAWRERAADAVRTLIERFWTGDRFVARHTLSQREIASDSLLTLMPVVLGDQLPDDVFRRCVERLLSGGYITEHGVATEPPTSPHYEADGYWRGPIWAPSTALLVDGLRRGGRADIADDIERRFVATCAAGGMAENFDALTGDGLRDLSMTWTASAFLTLTTSPAPSAGAPHHTEVRR